VSGVKLVLNWIVYRRIGARLSPIGSQWIDASRLLQVTLLSFGAFGTSITNKNTVSFYQQIFKYSYTKLLCLEKMLLGSYLLSLNAEIQLDLKKYAKQYILLKRQKN